MIISSHKLELFYYLWLSDKSGDLCISIFNAWKKENIKILNLCLINKKKLFNGR